MIQNTKYSRGRKGFTLVELLAVIVILAIILVIAVPKVMSIIEDAKMGTLESTVKMIASGAEKAKIQNTVLGKTEEITCDSVAKINKGDYASCSIKFENNTAKVTIEGKGKFENLWVCDGTKTNAKSTKDECEIEVVTEYSSEWEKLDYKYAMTIQGYEVWTNGTNIYYTEGCNDHYVLEGNTWVKTEWEGECILYFEPENLWMDGNNLYYSYWSNTGAPQGNYQYILNGDTWEKMTWQGYEQIVGVDVWTDGTNIYYSGYNTTYNDVNYVLQGDTWVECDLGKYVHGSNVWNDGVNTYYNSAAPSYMFNGNTWESKTWENGIHPSYGDDVWTDGTNIYCYNSFIGHFVLNNGVWEKKEWKGLSDVVFFDVRNIWSDGTKIYYSDWDNQFVLQGDTWVRQNWYSSTGWLGDVWTDGINLYSYNNLVLIDNTWEKKTWNGYECGSSVWNDGTNIYCSDYSNQYVLEGDTWVEKEWQGLTEFSGDNIYKIENNIYCSVDGNQYILQDNTWVSKTWYGLTEDDFYNLAYNVYTIGKNAYYYDGEYNHYKLNGDTWEQITWKGFPEDMWFQAMDVWTNGVNVYYSGSDSQYVLNGDTWEQMNWTGLTSFQGSSVWTYNGNIYCNDSDYSYILKIAN